MSVPTSLEQCREYAPKPFLLLIVLSSFAMLASCAGFTSGQTKPASPPSAPTAPSTSSQAQTYVNIRDYGAVGDGVHDDTPAILAAVNAAMQLGINIVEFPPTNPYYEIGTPLVLPRPTTSWMKLNLDASLNLNATMTIGGFYSIFGSNPFLQNSMSQDAQATIIVDPSLSPAIHIVGNDVKLENLFLYFHFGGDGDGILTDGVCCITVSNVSVSRTAGSGADVHIRGMGFDYIFEKGVYTADGTGPSFLIESPTNGNSTGFLAMRDVVLVGHGLQFSTDGPMTNYLFENILYESFQDSFLTINGTNHPYTPVYGLYLNNIIMADPVGTPAPMITNNNAQTSGVQIFNSPIYSTAVSGDPIQDLEIWSGVDVAVGQATNYVLHEPSGIVSTMPTGTPASAHSHANSIHPFSVKQF